MLPLAGNGFGEIILPPANKLAPKAAQIIFDNKGNLWGISQNHELFTVNMADSSVFVWAVEKTGSLNFLGFTDAGTLWISGSNGAFCITDLKKRNLQQVLDSDIKKAITDGNTVYFYTQKKVYKIEENEESWSLIAPVADIAIHSTDKSSKHLIAVTTNHLTPFLIAAVFNQPLLLIDKTTGTTAQYPFAGNNTLKYEVHTCYFSSASKLYIGTNQGFFKVSFGNKAFKTYTDTDIKLRCVTSISNDTLLFGTQGWGIMRYTRNGNGQWIKDKIKPVILAKGTSGYTINRFYTDVKGQFWAATNEGLCYKNNDVWKFVYSGLSIWGVTKDTSGVFWLGSNGDGLIKFDPLSKKSEVFFHLRKSRGLKRI